MKSKKILWACGLLLTIVSSGCGMLPSIEPIETEQQITEEISKKDAKKESEVGEEKEELKKRALIAYQEILKAAPSIEGEHEELADASFDYEQNLQMFGNHYDMFALSDINQDGMPELIALTRVNFRWNLVSIYIFEEGKAVLLKDPLNAEGHGTFEQRSTANGAYITYICEENHIHSVWSGTNPIGEQEEENSAYILEGTTLIETNCTAGESENTIYIYDLLKENVEENVEAITQSLS